MRRWPPLPGCSCATLAPTHPPMTHSRAAMLGSQLAPPSVTPSQFPLVKPVLSLESPSPSHSGWASPLWSNGAPSPASTAITPRPVPLLLNSDEQFIDDVSLHYLYQPHTILSFFVVLALLLYFAFHPSSSSSSPTASLVTNVKLALFVCSLFLLLLGLFVFPSGPFIRPHPLLWRLSFGLGVVYELALLMLLFQTTADARASLSYVYPELGRPLQERTYGDNCELTWDNVRASMDIFVVGHLLGWMVKSLILRDRLMCWCISIQWEFIELCFRHWLPNFKECAWDSIVLDVLLCNGIGIELGHLLCERLEMRAYRWTRLQDIPTVLGKVRRAALQFTPSSWTAVRWESTRTITRFLVVNIVVLSLNLAELNAFLLKALLWIPPPNPLNFFRLVIWALLGPSAIRQVYIYTSNPHVKSIGTFTFLSCCILSTELLLIAKLSKGEFTAETPKQVKVGLAVGLLLYALVVAAVCLRISRRGEGDRRDAGDKLKQT